MALTGFPAAARRSLADSQLRANLARATSTIRDKRGRVVDELPDWEELRAAGAAIKDSALLELDTHLSRLESAVAAAGGVVHWAKDGDEACSIVAAVARSHGVDEVVKVKSIATDEIGLNEQLAAEGIAAVETDLAELIIQLDEDFPSHILVPAIHRNRAEIRDIFRRELGLDALTDEPAALAEAARLHLRAKFLSARMGVSGANFAVAQTGSVCVFESEGNGRMCTTLPEVLVTVMGIEKVVPSWCDMEVFLQLLPRSSTGERMNPYTSVWTGIGPPGEASTEDGPREFHLVLLDNGRVRTLADDVGRQALRCIRCSACLNVCPVYTRVGGHAYGSVYPGPIGAILAPQLVGIDEDPSPPASPPGASPAAASSGSPAAVSPGSPAAASSGGKPAPSREHAASLPYASSLCGACGEVCPVKIEIPRLLTHLRAREVSARRRLDPEKLTMKALFHTFSSRRRYERAQKLARAAARPLTRGGRACPRAGASGTGTKAKSPRGAGTDGKRPGVAGAEGKRPRVAGTIPWAPGPLSRWTSSRDLPAPAPETFREWWRQSGRSNPPGQPAAPGEPARARTMSALGMTWMQNADMVARAERLSGAGPAPTPSGAAPAASGDARADILRRIRGALRDAAPADIPRNYRTEDTRERDEIVTLFAERVAEYRATVHTVRAGEVGETVARIAAKAGASRIGIPADLPREWRPAGEARVETGQMVPERQEGRAEVPRARTDGPGEVAPAPGEVGAGWPAEIELVEDASLSVPQLDELDGAITGCAVAIAETGTFVLDAGTTQGRRALTLVPDLHICVVREDQIVGLVPEAVARLEESVRTGRPLTFVSGPSATSDIELDRVEGVHGPRVLHVVVVAS